MLKIGPAFLDLTSACRRSKLIQPAESSVVERILAEVQLGERERRKDHWQLHKVAALAAQHAE